MPWAASSLATPCKDQGDSGGVVHEELFGSGVTGVSSMQWQSLAELRSKSHECPAKTNIRMPKDLLTALVVASSLLVADSDVLTWESGGVKL